MGDFSAAGKGRKTPDERRTNFTHTHRSSSSVHQRPRNGPEVCGSVSKTCNIQYYTEHETDFWLIYEEPQSLEPDPTNTLPVVQIYRKCLLFYSLPPCAKAAAATSSKRGGHRVPFGITSAAARLRERSVWWGAGRGCCRTTHGAALARLLGLVSSKCKADVRSVIEQSSPFACICA
jgi:hypothetical protein